MIICRQLSAPTGLLSEMFLSKCVTLREMGLALLEKENRGMLVLNTPFIFTFVSGLHLTVITFTSNQAMSREK